jgi:Ni/Co efflux regulator RcnB
MYPRFTKVLTAFALTSAIAVPAVAQARGGSDDPANHEQRQHQVQNRDRHDRRDNDRRDHRRDGRGSDDGPNHR